MATVDVKTLYKNSSGVTSFVFNCIQHPNSIRVLNNDMNAKLFLKNNGLTSFYQLQVFHTHVVLKQLKFDGGIFVEGFNKPAKVLVEKRSVIDGIIDANAKLVELRMPQINNKTLKIFDIVRNSYIGSNNRDRAVIDDFYSRNTRGPLNLLECTSVDDEINLISNRLEIPTVVKHYTSPDPYT